MDIAICAGLATLEVLVAVGGLSTEHSLLKTFLGLFVSQYLLLKCYRIFIYPFYVSPLRHLPGPKVGREMYIV
jgi:hypothetical protein